jgi:hypothetical protein
MRQVGSVSQSDSAGNEQTRPLTPPFIPVIIPFSCAQERHVRYMYKYREPHPKTLSQWWWWWLRV